MSRPSDLRENLLVWLGDEPALSEVVDACAELIAECSVALAGTDATPAIAEAAQDFLDAVSAHGEPVPSDFQSLARTILAPANVVPIRRKQTPQPAGETFLLLAASTARADRALLCQSQSGLWTIEVFTGQSEADRAAARGYLLLAVHRDHGATYNGRIAKIFVTMNGVERVLAETAIKDGQLHAEVLLSGLDLHTRDAINVTFGPLETEE